MRMMLLGLAAPMAAFFVPAAMAQAQSLPAAGFTSGPAFAASSERVFVQRDGVRRSHGDFRRDRRDDDDGDRRDRRRDRRSDALVYIDREYQGDSAWRSEGFNDWWHERPNRSFPRWVQNNQDCERVWWSGGGWRC